MTARAPIVLAMLVLLAGCGPDHRQVRLCQRVLAEVEGPGRYARVGAEALPRATPGVALLLSALPADGAVPAADTPTRRFVCRFAASRFEYGQGNLVGVVAADGHELSLAALLYLKTRLGLH
jgi:hypothetical protein